jgi:hypothetical protein
MFFQILYIHLFRPFLKYSQTTSPLPPNVSPRRLCTQAATAISKLLRLYKRSHGLRQICNIAVYIAHTACTIHLLNLPDKNSKRDFTHGVKHLEEIAESWLCARRTLGILSALSRQWKVDLPEEAAAVLSRTDVKFAAWNRGLRSRYPSKTPSKSPEHNPAEEAIHHPPTNLLGNLSTAPDAGSTFNVALSAANTGLEIQPPRNALPNQQASPTSPLSNLESGSYSSRILGGADQVLRSDSGDWWVQDQRQLAQGFAQWSQDDNSMWQLPATSQPVMNSIQTIPFADDPLARLFAMNRNGMPGDMQYPNESEWYQ